MTYTPPVEAVKLAAREAGISTYEARAALTAAGPIIAAQALRDAADDPAPRLSGHSGISITRLRARAATIERKSE